MEITEQLLKELCSNGVTLDEYLVLYDKYYSLGLRRVYKADSHTYDGLRGKGFISEKTGNILADGRDLLETIWAAADTKDSAIQDYGEDFEKF